MSFAVTWKHIHLTPLILLPEVSQEFDCRTEACNAVNSTLTSGSVRESSASSGYTIFSPGESGSASATIGSGVVTPLSGSGNVPTEEPEGSSMPNYGGMNSGNDENFSGSSMTGNCTCPTAVRCTGEREQLAFLSQGIFHGFLTMHK